MERPFPRSAFDVPLWFSMSELQRLTTNADLNQLWTSKQAYDEYWSCAVTYAGVAATHTAYMSYAIAFARYRRMIVLGQIPPPASGQRWEDTPEGYQLVETVLSEIMAASVNFSRTIVDPIGNPYSPSFLEPPPTPPNSQVDLPSTPCDDSYSDMESSPAEPEQDPDLSDLHEILSTLVTPPPMPTFVEWTFDDDEDAAAF